MATNLDDELQRAVDTAESDAPAVAKPIQAQPAVKKPASKGSVALLVALLAMAGGIVALFLVGFKEASIYAVPIDEVVTKGSQLEGRRLRVEGELVPGTLVKRESPCEYQFKIQNKGVEMPVKYASCDIPDGFRDRPEGGVMVTVEGQLASGGKTFEAQNVMAKCASKYNAETHEIDDPNATQQVKSPSTSAPAAP